MEGVSRERRGQESRTQKKTSDLHSDGVTHLYSFACSSFSLYCAAVSFGGGSPKYSACAGNGDCNTVKHAAATEPAPNRSTSRRAHEGGAEKLSAPTTRRLSILAADKSDENSGKRDVDCENL